MKSRAYLDSPTVINLGRQDATCGSFTQVTCINFNEFTVQSHAHLLGKDLLSWVQWNILPDNCAGLHSLKLFSSVSLLFANCVHVHGGNNACKISSNAIIYLSIAIPRCVQSNWSEYPLDMAIFWSWKLETGVDASFAISKVQICV